MSWPLLVAMFRAERLVVPDRESEAHLHPWGQTKLADLAVRATKAGVQVIAETHSDHFMDGISHRRSRWPDRAGGCRFPLFERGDEGAAVVSSAANRQGRTPVGMACRLLRPARRESRPASGARAVTMREMVLNHASLAAGDPYAVVGFLKDVVSGMAQLVKKEVTATVLRSTQIPAEIPCAPGFSLYDAMKELQQGGAHEEYRFLVKMATKAPLLSDVEADVRHRFLTCEIRNLPPKDGEPILLCALIGGVAIGFPTSAEWDRDRIAVVFDELRGDGTIFSEETEEIDHLARASPCRSDLRPAPEASPRRFISSRVMEQPAGGLPRSRLRT